MTVDDIDMMESYLDGASVGFAIGLSIGAGVVGLAALVVFWWLGQ
jgi:hypothetical protein